MGYKLMYFNFRGYGEYIRLLLVDNGIDFEDKQLTFEEWPEYKNSMPFLQIPCLFDDEKQIAQTGTILRYLGKKLDLSGGTDDEQLFVDMFFEGVRDMKKKYVNMIRKDYENGREPFIKKTCPAMLANFEKLIQTYENGTKFIAGKKVTYADYALFEDLDVVLNLDGHILDNFPLLKSFHERFSSRPTLKNYLKRRDSGNNKINGNGKQ